MINIESFCDIIFSINTKDIFISLCESIRLWFWSWCFNHHLSYNFFYNWLIDYLFNRPAFSQDLTDKLKITFWKFGAYKCLDSIFCLEKSEHFPFPSNNLKIVHWSFELLCSTKLAIKYSVPQQRNLVSLI